MPSAIEEGRIPAIKVFHRAWYDENVAAKITMEPPKKVTRATSKYSLTIIFRDPSLAKLFVCV